MNTYNGWTNYATWLINLEIFDNFDIDGYSTDTYELSIELEDYLGLYIDDTSEGLAKDYALAFISEVNYYEIAKHLLESEE
jgi:hypothetical protein